MAHLLQGLVEAGIQWMCSPPVMASSPPRKACTASRCTGCALPEKRIFCSGPHILASSAGARDSQTRSYGLCITARCGTACCSRSTRHRWVTRCFEVTACPPSSSSTIIRGSTPVCWQRSRSRRSPLWHLSDAIICPSNVTRDYIASLGLSRNAGDRDPERGQPVRIFPRLLCRAQDPTSAGPALHWHTGGLAGIGCGDPGPAGNPGTAGCSTPYCGAGAIQPKQMLAKQIRKLGLEDASPSSRCAAS